MDSSSQPDNDKIAQQMSGQFLRLLMAHQSRIYAFILGLVPNWVEADDIFQEVSTVLWQKYAQFEPGSDFVAWAIQVSRFQVMNHRKKQRRSVVQFDQELVDLIERDRQSDRVREDKRLEALERCVHKLCQRDRQIIQMRYEESATMEGMSRRIGISVRALYKTLGRIHGNLLRCVRLGVGVDS